MDPPISAIKGRGAASNPANRFLPLAFLPDPEERDPDDPGPRTLFMRDSSRSAISRNDSPDIGFTHGLNPYRGCEHGCSYCLSGDTLVLMSNGQTRELRDLRPGDEIYGTERRGFYRRYVRTVVLDHWRTTKRAVRIELADGTAITASGDHRFLTERGWKYVTGATAGTARRPHLTVGNRLLGTGAFQEAPKQCPSYRAGYLCGMVRGDAHLASYRYARAGRSNGDQHQFRLALADSEALDRSADYLAGFGVRTRRFIFQRATSTRRQVEAIRTHAAVNVEKIREIISWPSLPSAEWQRGFLAGLFDAEGAHDMVLRISNTDREIIEMAARCLASNGFRYREELTRRSSLKPVRVIRALGGLPEILRFFHLTDPAIRRKRSLEGRALKSSADLRITSIRDLGIEIPMYDITTGTGDFIANGVVSHNCYARPTHEYLGFSAGLDFESRILVKEELPELLRKELSSPRWKPATVMMSGVTDCYQPAERRLRVTRRCLEVLAEFRNPVGIVTKNHLVTRDLDLLAELASHGAARVNLSITSLDPKLQRVMEPRTATPARRLDAVRRLAAAGVPVGVMVAPVIPGLTDHEMPRILEAAAEAGATSAGMVPLRLPYAVAPLFESWLETHFPERKDRVLNRIREIRGGRLNDARFGSRMRGEGEYAEQMGRIFRTYRRRFGLDGERSELSTAAFRRPHPGDQTDLFG